MNTLKDGERRLLIAGLGTLAVFGSVVLGAVFFAILLGLGLNEDLAWGLSVLIWIAVVAFGIGSLVYYYDSIKKRLEHFTAMRTVVTHPPTQETQTVGDESKSGRDHPSLPEAPPPSYRSMLLDEDKKDDQSA